MSSGDQLLLRPMFLTRKVLIFYTNPFSGRIMCEYDMCAREDPSDNTPLCTMVSALAAACEKADIIVDWQADSALRELCDGKSISIA
jgi:hypothetical protein